MYDYSRLATRAVAATLMAAIVACSDSTGIPGGSAPTQLAFTTRTPTGSTAAEASAVPVTKGGHTLDLTQVSVTVDRADLKRAHEDACRGNDDDEDDDSAPAAAAQGDDGSQGKRE